ncbi:MAG: hypothetical protein JXM73_04265 [Anaerolineae bacterium]|nr:hypothetical protein [Anaerolineae bacterium]
MPDKLSRQTHSPLVRDVFPFTVLSPQSGMDVMADLMIQGMSQGHVSQEGDSSERTVFILPDIVNKYVNVGLLAACFAVVQARTLCDSNLSLACPRFSSAEISGERRRVRKHYSIESTQADRRNMLHQPVRDHHDIDWRIVVLVGLYDLDDIF